MEVSLRRICSFFPLYSFLNVSPLFSIIQRLSSVFCANSSSILVGARMVALHCWEHPHLLPLPSCLQRLSIWLAISTCSDFILSIVVSMN